MRHAKAVKSKDMSDLDRPLKEKGIEDAIKVAKILQKSQNIPDYIITSNAVRAVQTWNVMKSHLSPVGQQIKSHFLYLKGAAFYYDAVKNIPDYYDNALLIGHNPDIFEFLQGVVKQSQQSSDLKIKDKFPTSSIISLKFSVNIWSSIISSEKNYI